MRTKPSLTSSDVKKMLAACEAKASENKWAVAISKIGLLRGRRHTSNGLAYLRSKVPGYADATAYTDVPAVRDGNLITASGLGDVEFARELFEELDVLPPKARSLWAQIFRSAKLPEGVA